MTAARSIIKWYQELSTIAKAALIEIGVVLATVALHLSTVGKIGQGLVIIGSMLLAAPLVQLMAYRVVLVRVCIPNKAKLYKGYKYVPPDLGC